jgi:Uncharacterized protein conserved in bacteria
MTISIIAGKGNFPKIIAKNSLISLVVCIKGLSNPNDFKNKTTVVSLLEIEKLIQKLNYYKIKKIAFAGKFLRPNLNQKEFDKSSRKIINQISYKGDEVSLNIIKSFFLNKGFEIISPSILLENNFIKSNVIFSKLNDEKKIKFIKKSAKNGINLLNKISNFDVGQSVVLLDKHVIGIEGLEGTNELIKRCGMLYKKYLKHVYELGPILVKFPKKNQSLDLDMPVIGIDTIKLCEKNNFLGVVVSSFGTLVLDKNEILDFIKTKDFYFYSTGG